MPAYSFKRRFVVPIKLGLGLPYAIDDIVTDLATASLPKRQTIRAVGKRRHARPGETVQLYHGMRTKQCFKIGDARCTKILPISIFFETEELLNFVEIGEYQTADFCRMGDDRELDEFARTDGFSTWSDMRQFWSKEHAGIDRFEGVLIQWEPIDVA